MKYHTTLVDSLKQGKNRDHCIVCLYGFHKVVDDLLLKGVTKVKIASVIKSMITKNEEYSSLRGVFVPRAYDVNYHMRVCSEIGRSDRLLAQKARRMLKKQKATISEVNEMVMEHIARSIGLSSSIKDEELEKLSPKEKMVFATEATKLLQTEKRIALEARKNNLEEVKFLSDVGALASGSAVTPEAPIALTGGVGAEGGLSES